ncbi:hypothetical protein [Burkholderia plantarii]|uniref:hypothetical protein n=1 Tax=Burkholderia plantarii TaxID=41899 RepID=UPI0018DE4A82|nr:hypothetical protein [Burkholderia plantarii]MBI0330886.1 hypothetical protein [Burkholderia plantarii]
MKPRDQQDPATTREAHERRAAPSPQPASPDPHDPVACPDWWSEPGALPTGASEVRHVPEAYREPGMMRRAAECRGGPAPPEDSGADAPLAGGGSGARR